MEWSNIYIHTHYIDMYITEAWLNLRNMYPDDDLLNVETYKRTAESTKHCMQSVMNGASPCDTR
jgi:hypothetical protein